MLEKRSEINTELKEREDARQARMAERRAELEQRVSAALGRNIIHERIARAYPHLAEGEHNGSHFRTLLERAGQAQEKKKRTRTLKNTQQNAPVKPVRFFSKKKASQSFASADAKAV